jgi:hypothetical protein
MSNTDLYIPEHSLNFTVNWNNKLDCNFFTAIRKLMIPYIPDCYKAGTRYNLRLAGKYYGTCTIIDSKVIAFSQLTDWHITLDTGLPPKEGREVLRKLAKELPGVDFNLCWILLSR